MTVHLCDRLRRVISNFVMHRSLLQYHGSRGFLGHSVTTTVERTVCSGVTLKTFMLLLMGRYRHFAHQEIRMSSLTATDFVDVSARTRPPHNFAICS